MLRVGVSRLLVILMLLAAALPAAAGAQTTTPEPPVATTGLPDAITETAANLNGTVDPNGSTDHLPLRVRHVGRLRAHHAREHRAGGDRSRPVKAALTGLTKNTIYHYRLVATNVAGISRGADRTFRTDAGPQPPRVKSTASRDVQSRTVDAHRRRSTPTSSRPRCASSTAARHALRLVHRPRRRRLGRRLRAGLDPARRPAAEHALPLPRGRDQRQRHRPQPRPLVRHHARADRHQRHARAQQGRLGRRPDRHRPHPRHRRGRHARRAASARASRSRAASPRSRARRRERRHVPVQRQLAVPDHALPRRDAHRARRSRARIYTASSAVKVGARSRSRGPPQGAASRARSGRSVPNGRVSLQKRSPRGRWAVVKRQAAQVLDANARATASP